MGWWRRIGGSWGENARGTAAAAAAATEAVQRQRQQHADDTGAAAPWCPPLPRAPPALPASPPSRSAVPPAPAPLRGRGPEAGGSVGPLPAPHPQFEHSSPPHTCPCAPEGTSTHTHEEHSPTTVSPEPPSNTKARRWMRSTSPCRLSSDPMGSCRQQQQRAREREGAQNVGRGGEELLPSQPGQQRHGFVGRPAAPRPPPPPAPARLHRGGVEPQLLPHLADDFPGVGARLRVCCGGDEGAMRVRPPVDGEGWQRRAASRGAAQPAAPPRLRCPPPEPGAAQRGAAQRGAPSVRSVRTRSSLLMKATRGTSYRRIWRSTVMLWL